MKDDRYQFQPWYVKTYRWIRWMPCGYVTGCYRRVRWLLSGRPPMTTIDGEIVMQGRQMWETLWTISISEAQGKMRFVYTMDEVFSDLRKKGATP